MCTLFWVELFHTMLQKIQNPILFSVPLLVILVIQVIFIVAILSIEHVCFICLWFSNVRSCFFFFLSIKLKGAVKAEYGGETVLKSEDSGRKGGQAVKLKTMVENNK